MTTRRALVPFTLTLCWSLSLPLQAGPQFSDGALTNSSWTAVKIFDNSAGQTATFSASEMLTGGVGNGPYRANSLNYSYDGSPTNQGELIGNLSSGIVYTPAVSGPIVAITSFGLAADSAITGGGSSRVGLLLLQGGIYFTNQLQGIGGFGNPIKLSSVLPAASFMRVGSATPPLNPDFSTNGGPIQFGYVSASFLGAGSSPVSVSGVIGVDLYTLSISNTPFMPRFINSSASGSNLLVTLTGLAPGEMVSWYVSTNLVNWALNNPPNSATDTNGTFTVTNSAYPGAANWFLKAQIQ